MKHSFTDADIRSYIYGEMEGELLQRFEETLGNDSDLQDEVDLMAFLIADYNVKKKKEFDSLIPDNHIIPKPIEESEKTNVSKSKVRSIQPEGKKTNSFLGTVLKVAAVVFLVGFLSVLALQFINNTTSPSQLADTYIEQTYSAPVVSRSEEDINKTWANAIDAYKAKDYNKSAKLIEQIQKSGASKDNYSFYLGLSYLYQSPPQINKAITNLNNVDGDYYNEAAVWHKSLAYIKAGQKNKAIESLKTIRNSSRKDDIAKLLESLK